MYVSFEFSSTVLLSRDKWILHNFSVWSSKENSVMVIDLVSSSYIVRKEPQIVVFYLIRVAEWDFFSFCPHSEASKELVDAESDDDSCQIMTEMNTTTERRNSAVSTPSNVPNQSVPVLTSNAGVWKNIVPNMNLPILNVNQMLASNIIDSSLFTGPTVSFFERSFKY